MSTRSDYFGELLANWRVLAAAGLGMGVGLQLFSYITSIFAPFLVAEFGWSKAQFALIGLGMFATLAALPLAGRLTDRFGVRIMALVGVLATPLVLLSYSLMQGSFSTFFVNSACMLAIGSLTGPITWSRLIAERFVNARGLALTVVMSVPALFGAAGAQAVTWYITEFGWRSGYRVLAVVVLVLGLVAIMLIPKGSGRPSARAAGERKRLHGFGEVLRSPIFWVIFAGMLLSLLHTPLHGSQLNLVLGEQGLDAMAAAKIVSIYALGTIAGRFACGIALDALPTRAVAFVSMVLPAFGLALLASSYDSFWAIALAMALVGITVGAEGDLLSFLVARYFRLEIFSTALSLCYCAVFIASSSGALLMSGTVKLTASYSPFLWLAAVSVAIGSLLFLRLPSGGGRAMDSER